MPILIWLGSFLVSILSSAASFFLQYMTKRLAIMLAVISGIGALTTAFFVAIYAVAVAIVPVMPPAMIQGASLFLPDNLPGVLTACFSARLIRWVYEWNIKVIQMRLT